MVMQMVAYLCSPSFLQTQNKNDKIETQKMHFRMIACSVYAGRKWINAICHVATQSSAHTHTHSSRLTRAFRLLLYILESIELLTPSKSQSENKYLFFVQIAFVAVFVWDVEVYIRCRVHYASVFELKWKMANVEHEDTQLEGRTFPYNPNDIWVHREFNLKLRIFCVDIWIWNEFGINRSLEML